MHLYVAGLKIVGIQLATKRKWNLATEASACWQLAVQLAKLHDQMADEPTLPLLSALAQTVELLLRYRHLLQLPAHQVEKVDASCLVTQEQVAERGHDDWRVSRRDKLPPIGEQRLRREAVHFCCQVCWN
jgi:hypothetical protein